MAYLSSHGQLATLRLQHSISPSHDSSPTPDHVRQTEKMLYPVPCCVYAAHLYAWDMVGGGRVVVHGTSRTLRQSQSVLGACVQMTVQPRSISLLAAMENGWLIGSLLCQASTTATTTVMGRRAEAAICHCPFQVV